MINYDSNECFGFTKVELSSSKKHPNMSDLLPESARTRKNLFSETNKENLNAANLVSAKVPLPLSAQFQKLTLRNNTSNTSENATKNNVNNLNNNNPLKSLLGAYPPGQRTGEKYALSQTLGGVRERQTHFTYRRSPMIGGINGSPNSLRRASSGVSYLNVSFV